ncbi:MULTISPECIES: sensor domain-containing diguanylate cyclase [unclassified Janthinobacterium]|uniref:sensor domain-containing diguanylate cyclase n=1 Tax=unclassified Janthinobacterium TaxID=2610881 RepID=UPI00034A8775|nr:MULTISPECIES: CHASE domain-containing protein [unclassified Janthinobacterium]MEC5159216.1 diguanylate cyclase (GGDEF)-like protein/PAS domain S-box-containing protein [Janthinobacterium sp. CG_S6]
MNQTRSMPPAVRSIEDWLGPRFLSLLILGVCLCFTYGAWRGAEDDAQRQVQAEFDSRVRELVNLLASRMQTYLQVLYGAQGLFVSSDVVDRAEFHDYLAVQQIDLHFPGIQGVGFMRVVPREQREAHIATLRRDGFPDYTIKPAGARALYAPIVYLEPFSGSNLRAFGFDPYSEPVRRAALERARDSGQAAMTGKISLVQENDGQDRAGFLIAMPLYDPHRAHATLAQRREAIRGWVYAAFRMDDLMAGLGGAGALDMEVYDGDAVGAGQRMHGGAPGAAAALARHSRQSIDVAGRRWSVLVGAGPGFERAAAAKPLLLAWAGALLGLGLAALTWLLARSRAGAKAALHRAGLLAAQLKQGQASVLAMAETAQRSQAVLRSILDSTVDGILVDDLQGRVLNSNRRFRELWQVADALDWQADAAALFAHIERQLRQAAVFARGRVQAPRDHRERHDLLQLHDGRVIEQVVRSMQLGSEQARLWSFRDITERSQVEQRERTRRHVLELLATGASLASVLEGVVVGVEAGHPAMLCSIALLDGEGRQALLGAAPSLPDFFNAAMHGQPLAAAAAGVAALRGRRVVVADIAVHPLWQGQRELAARAGVAACWSEPVRGGSGALLGAFTVYHRRAHQPSAANIALIEEAAHLAGMVIEQAQAALALRAGEARFRSLYDNAPVALWEQDWSAVRAELVALERAGVDDLAAYLLGHPQQVARLAGLVRILDVNAAALAQVGADGRAAAAALSLAQNFDAPALPAFARALAALAQGAQLFACEGSFVRLDGVARQNELTLLVMPGHERSLDFVIVSTLDITERKRMNDELLVLATTDFLTGLPNRRHFMARLDQEHARLRREIDSCAAVLMLDLDHFKTINDAHGHAVGDAVLRHLAALMFDGHRKVDTLGRIGGEEFAVLLPGTDLAAAGVFAERLRQRVADTPLVLADARIAVTVSIGVAAMSRLDTGYDAVLVRADKALYRAKGAGRNRVETGLGAERGPRAS